MTSTKRRFGWTTAIGLAVTIPLLWWALHDVHFSEVWSEFLRADKIPLLATMLTVSLSIPVRAARWRILMQSKGKKLPLGPLYHATAAGFAINNLLPARAGEVARAYTARRLTGIPFSVAMTTIVISRMLDGVVLFIFLAVPTLIGWFSPSVTLGGVTVTRIMTVATVVFLAFFMTALAAVEFPRQIIGPIAKLFRRTLPDTLAEKAVHGLRGILHSLSVIRRPRVLLEVFVWSLVISGINGLSFLFAFMAFDLDVPWHGAYVLQSLVNFGLVIPSTPGFVGVFEAVTRASLSLYGVGATAAVSFAVVYHFCSYVPVTLMGLWSLAHTHIRMSDVREEVSERVSVAVLRLSGSFDNPRKKKKEAKTGNAGSHSAK